MCKRHTYMKKIIQPSHPAPPPQHHTDRLPYFFPYIYIHKLIPPPPHTPQQIVYPVDGGMEDWAYAASWDNDFSSPPPVVPCAPDTYGGASSCCAVVSCVCVFGGGGGGVGLSYAPIFSHVHKPTRAT